MSIKKNFSPNKAHSNGIDGRTRELIHILCRIDFRYAVDLVNLETGTLQSTAKHARKVIITLEHCEKRQPYVDLLTDHWIEQSARRCAELLRLANGLTASPESVAHSNPTVVPEPRFHDHGRAPRTAFATPHLVPSGARSRRRGVFWSFHDFEMMGLKAVLSAFRSISGNGAISGKQA